MQGSDVAANEPTPWVGLYERITIVGYLAWRVVLAMVLLRTASPTVSVADTPEKFPEPDSS